MFRETSGGYCGRVPRVPPLPIPNREVKPACADGTAMQCGRVGSRLLSDRELQNYCSEALFLCVFLDIQEKPEGPESLVFLSNPDYYLSYIDIKTVLKLIFFNIFIFKQKYAIVMQ